MGFDRIGEVGDGEDYDFIDPALCRIGHLGSGVAIHSAFIGNRRIYCVEEEKVEGHRVFECRKIDFRRMSNPWAAQEKK